MDSRTQKPQSSSVPTGMGILFGNSSAVLKPSPIRQSWILEGDPIARNCTLSTSADGTAFTVIWDCTAGRFNWFYRIDETVYVLEGAVTLKDPSGASRRVAAGDTVFFPAGSRAEWTVDVYVKKIAFLRSPLPAPLAYLRRSLKRFMGWLRGEGQRDASGMS